MAQYYWEHYVDQYGIDASKVEIINTTDATSLLSTGQADAYAMTIPILEYFSSLGMGKILDDSTKVENGYTSYLFEVANSVLDENPEVGVAINKALIRAYDAAIENPQDLYEAVSSKQIGADCYAKEYAFDTSFEYLSPEITDESILHHLTAAVGEFIDKNTLLITMKEFATDEFHQIDNPVAFLIRTYISLLLDVSVENIDLSDYDKIRKYITKNKTDRTVPQWWNATIL